MLRWLLRLFGGGPSRPVPIRVPTRLDTTVGQTVAGEHATTGLWERGSDPLPAIPSLDRVREDATHQEGLFQRVTDRLESGRINLSQLPSTTMAVMEIASKPQATVDQVVLILERDPVLSSELLKTANSVAYGSRVRTDSIRDAVMRIGMRTMRSMILGISMRSALLHTPSLKAFGEKVWRQSFTVASIARNIAPLVSFQPEHAFLLGLLHDIGKVALLDTLSKELKRGETVTPALVGRLFFQLHERAGRQMATSWKLSEELISVSGNHHEFESNTDFPRSAALVSLCHRIELSLSLSAAGEFRSLLAAGEFAALGIEDGETIQEVLTVGRATFSELRQKPITPQQEAAPESLRIRLESH